MEMLIGTEKQVKWAKDIKENMVNAIEMWEKVAKETENSWSEIVIELAEEIKSNKSAKWFIENREYLSNKRNIWEFDTGIYLKEKGLWNGSLRQFRKLNDAYYNYSLEIIGKQDEQ